MTNFFTNHPIATGTALASSIIRAATTFGHTSKWYLGDKAQIRINRAVLSSGGITNLERKSLENHTFRKMLRTSTLETVGKSAKTMKQASLMILVCMAINDCFKNT